MRTISGALLRKDRATSAPAEVQQITASRGSRRSHAQVLPNECVLQQPVTQTAQQAEEGAPVCKVNRMKWCHTDLGAVAYSWERLMTEDLRFAELKGKFTGEDAMMAELLVRQGWQIDHEDGRCLFDQGPNPQMCARLGGVLPQVAACCRPDRSRFVAQG